MVVLNLFYRCKHGWAVGSGGTILKSTNGGVTFLEEEDELYFIQMNFH